MKNSAKMIYPGPDQALGLLKRLFRLFRAVAAVHDIHLLLDRFVVNVFEEAEDEVTVQAEANPVFNAVADDLVPAFQL